MQARFVVAIDELPAAVEDVHWITRDDEHKDDTGLE